MQFAGILYEGKLLHKEFDAEQIANELRSSTGRPPILKCAARLYTLETFLYKLVNLTLRNDDRSKIDTSLISLVSLVGKEVRFIHLERVLGLFFL